MLSIGVKRNNNGNNLHGPLLLRCQVGLDKPVFITHPCKILIMLKFVGFFIYCHVMTKLFDWLAIQNCFV